MTDQPEPEDVCRPVDIDGEIIRVRGVGEMSDESREALADVIAAAKRKMAAEAPQQIGALQNRLRLAHQARRAKEHQLDDIRRALCDIGFMDDDDPYSHADLADVIRQNRQAAAAGTERDRYRAAILDIDAHATPIGLANPDDPDGNPHHYAVTVGALHRALGKIGHTAAPCTAEAALARIRALADEHPVAIPTHLIDEALDQPAAEPAATEPDTRYTQAIADVQSSGPAVGGYDGPSIAEAAADDRRWFDCEREGE